MIKFIKRTSLFASLLVMLFVGMNLFQGEYNNEPVHYRKQYDALIQNQNNFNGIILGTSHATHAIQPTILDHSGIRFYNFALNGSDPQFYLHFWEHFVQDIAGDVEYCILSVDNYFLAGKSWRKFEQDAEYFPDSTFLDILFDPQYDATMLLANRFPAIKYRTRLLNSLRLEIGDERYLADDYDRGYIPYELPYDSKIFVKNNHANVPISDVQAQRFIQLITQILAKEIKIVFVMPPEYDLQRQEYQGLKDLMFRLSDRYDIPFLDYNNDSTSTLNQRRYFNDKVHMNHVGSQAFSTELAQKLRSIYFGD